MNDRVVLVTGSSKGIGAAIARRFAKAGYFTYVTYCSDEAGGDATLKSITEAGGAGAALHLDVRSESSVAGAFERVQTDFGRLDVLVNNAVRELSKPINEATFEEWQTVIGTKIDGAFLCTRQALPLFASAESPSMLAISTFEAQQPSPEFTSYGVANAGLDAFVKAMALFLPKYGARCNAICPGPVKTPLWGPDESNEELWNSLAASNPAGRNATPEDVAEIALLIAEEPTRLVNGSFLYVNGGNHLRQA